MEGRESMLQKSDLMRTHRLLSDTIMYIYIYICVNKCAFFFMKFETG